MRKRIPGLLAVIFSLFFCAVSHGIQPGFQYPCYVVDSHDPDGNGLYGMDNNGSWWPFVAVDPNTWLIGPPPSLNSAVSLPTDHWVEMQFRGPIVDGPGYDIEIVERGRVREQALVFLTDGQNMEYLLTMITALDNDTGKNLPSYLQIDIEGLELPFEPRALRIVGLDEGGECDGFDLQYLTARINTECDGFSACNPIPVNTARERNLNPLLSWSPGTAAQKHIIYFGSSIDDAGPQAQPLSTPQGQDVNNFDPGTLELGQTYYWRVDEVNSTTPNKPHKGDIWTFTTPESIVIENYEVYNNYASGGQPTLYPRWQLPFYGFYTDISAEEQNVHGGAKSMLLQYNLSEAYEFDTEIKRVFAEPQNWNEFDLRVLRLFFRGRSDNGTGVSIYLSLNDGQVTKKIPYQGDPNNLSSEQWHQWTVDLDAVTDVNLSNIHYMGIGFADADPVSYTNDSGTLYFDDITIAATVCLESLAGQGDFNNDCTVNYLDMEQLSHSWLNTGFNIFPVNSPNEPLLWYRFEGNFNDSGSSGREGQILGNPIFFPGVYGQALRFDGLDDAVRVLGGQYLFSEIQNSLTIAFWQQDTNPAHDRDTICCSDFEYGIKNPTVAVNLGCWKKPGQYFWQAGSHWSFDNQLAGLHEYSNEWTGRWNHWAFTKDCSNINGPNNVKMEIYLNGVLINSRTDSTEQIGNVNSFTIGNGWYGGYEGVLDEFRIYNYALGPQEIAFIATNGTGIFDLPLLSHFDIKQDDAINFEDFAFLALNWLESNIWPLINTNQP